MFHRQCLCFDAFQATLKRGEIPPLARRGNVILNGVSARVENAALARSIDAPLFGKEVAHAG
jgi:hypothetical protein